MMKWILALIVFSFSIGFAHNSYTGGRSGAPGSSGSCASTCHGNPGGTITVTGFPANYVPSHVYRVVVSHFGGSPIVNFNATTRVGTGTTVAGTFTAVQNAVLYTGADGGVYANPHGIDSAVFQWTAPSSGTGMVNLYVAGMQGVATSSDGADNNFSISSNETLTAVTENHAVPGRFPVMQNFPNPFNPTTKISYRIPSASHVRLDVYNILGAVVAVLVDQFQTGGEHTISFNAVNLSSGVYYSRLQSNDAVLVTKMILMK